MIAYQSVLLYYKIKLQVESLPRTDSSNTSMMKSNHKIHLKQIHGTKHLSLTL